jgi:YVTN family beta-propeller protein
MLKKIMKLIDAPLLIMALGWLVCHSRSVCQADDTTASMPVAKYFASATGHPLLMSPHFNPIAISQGVVFVTNSAADTLDVIDANSNQMIRRVPVGIDPAGVAIRPDEQELWVTNHVSDSVSIIDINPHSPTGYQVIATLQDFDEFGATRFDEPVGVVFANDEKAYVSLSSENKIAVIDVAKRQIIKYLAIPAQDPRAIAVRNGKLLVLPFESNNQTQLSGGSRDKIDGNLVTFDAWEHSIVHNNVLSIGHVVDIVKNPNVPDKDLFLFDVESDQLLATVEGLGTLLYGLAVDSHGNAFITQTDARNDVNGRAGTKKHGLAELGNRPFLNRLTRVGWTKEKKSQVEFFDLEPLPPAQPDEGYALATPFAIRVSRDDQVLYATASGSDIFFTVDATTGKVLGRTNVGAVPEGLEIEYIDNKPARAWVFNAADNSVSVVDVLDAQSPRTLATIHLEDPTPEILKQGRVMFSTARASTSGTFSCASCHPDGHTDQLLWVLKTPIVSGGNQIMPRSTMPVRGLRDTAPFHWDGIPGDPYGGINSESIHASVKPNSRSDRPESATRHLVDGGLASTMSHVDDKTVNDEGKAGRLTSHERDAMAAFLLSVPYPPAQRRSYTDVLSKEAVRGFELFHLEGDHKPEKFKPDVCGNCHRMPHLVSTNTPGTGMDAPTWRGAYDRWLILPQGRLNMVEFDFYRDMATRGAPEREIWTLSWGGRPRFNPAWNMVLEASTGFSGAFARQVTLNRKSADDLSTRILVETLEKSAMQGAIVLHADGVQIDGANSLPISLRFDPSDSAKAFVPRDGGSTSLRSDEMMRLAGEGKLLITLIAHAGKQADAIMAQPALWTLGPIESQRGRQEFPIVNPENKVLVLSGRHFDRSAKLFVDGQRTEGKIDVGPSESVSITLEQLPPDGIHFLQVQAVDGWFSNEFIFHVASSPQEAVALRSKLDEPHSSDGSLRRILAEKSSVNDRRDDGSTPLNQAVIWGQTDIARELIERGASVDGTNSDGNTPLHLAAFFARRELVELLIAKGASIDAKNGNGEKPMDLVSVEWTEPLESFYRQIGVSLGLPIDIDQIRRDRRQIADLLH